MAFGHVLCQLVNWKLFRDTALNYCLKRLLSPTNNTKVPDFSLEVAAKILLAVDPFMEQNWGYMSKRYLDGYYFRLQRHCAQEIALSKTPEGQGTDLPFFMDVMVSHSRLREAAGTCRFLLPLDLAAALLLTKSRDMILSGVS